MGTSIAVDSSLVEVKSKQAAASRPGSNNARFKTVINGKQAFDAQAFLDSEYSGRMVAVFGRKETIFAQGDPAKNVMYIHTLVQIRILICERKEAEHLLA